MDPVFFFATIPKIALIVLLIVGVAIISEIIYFRKRKESKTPNAPPSPSPSVNQAQTGVPTPTAPKLTTEVIPPINKRRLPPKEILIAVFVIFFLITSIPATIILVKQRQETREQAAGCDMRWPADPNTTCGKSTQSPAQGATNVSLTPNFHWDYGGYRTGETGCVQPSGCDNYGAIVYLAKGNYSDSSIIASCGLLTGTSPIKDAPFSCFRVWRDGPLLSPLEPNTLYSWVVTPFGNGIVHAEQSWNYTFTTGAGATLACQALKTFDSSWNEISDLTKLVSGQSVYFAVNGMTAEPQGVTKARFKINGSATASWCTGTGYSLTGGWCETTNKHNNDFYIQYTVSSGATKVESMVFNPVLGWR